MNINDVYSFVKFLADKDQQGNFTPKNFNDNCPRALNELISKKYNNPMDKTPNKTGWQKDQKITDDLRFLLVRNEVSNVSPDGKLPLPADYLHLSSLVYNYKYSENGQTIVEPNEVDIVDDNEIAGFTGSSIYGKRIKAKKYVIAAFYSDHLQFYPKNINVVDLTYLRKPKNPFWAFTLTNGRPVYDPVNSVDLELPDELVNEFCMILASYLSINLRDAEFTQYIEMKKQQGV
jgi:hypothetical protein